MGVCYDKADRRRGYKGGIIIPKDKFKEFVEFSKEMGPKLREIRQGTNGEVR